MCHSFPLFSSSEVCPRTWHRFVTIEESLPCVKGYTVSKTDRPLTCLRKARFKLLYEYLLKLTFVVVVVTLFTKVGTCRMRQQFMRALEKVAGGPKADIKATMDILNT